MIRASRFYDKARGVLERGSNASLLMGIEATLVSEAADHVLVHLADGRVLRSQYVVDTRPQPRVLKTPWLWQNFVGYVVTIDGFAKGFDDTPTLMDFQHAGSDIARFMYVLPCGGMNFLCEYTNFSRQQGETMLLEQELVAWLDQRAGRSWRLLRRESGSLPMAPPLRSTQGRVFSAGTRGGSMRISTGYAFHRIQRWADQCATSILTTGVPLAPTRSRVLDGMDELFLRVLQQRSVSADELFYRLFDRCPTDPLVRFLAGVPRFGDLWSVARSLPWSRFLEAAPSLAGAWAEEMRESQ
jgi:lycopene beta-cyclase